jgi:hypothetical protein
MKEARGRPTRGNSKLAPAEKLVLAEELELLFAVLYLAIPSIEQN